MLSSEFVWLPPLDDPIECACGQVFYDTKQWRDHRRRHYAWSDEDAPESPSARVRRYRDHGFW
jgi:hypothetical protein